MLFSFAEQGEFSYSSILTSASGNNSVLFPQAPQRNGFQQIISAKSPRVYDLLVQISYFDIKNDYSNFQIQDRLGNSITLDKTFNKPEGSSSISLDYASGDYNSNLSFNSSVTDSPFRFSILRFFQNIRINSDLSQLSFAISYGNLSQPLTYFTDISTAERKFRPQNLILNDIQIKFDQVLSSILRAALVVESNSKSDRPRSLGLTARVAMALSSKDFIKTEFSNFSELRAHPLKDERGYFDLYSGEVNYSRYLTYDWYVSISYGLVVEHEENKAAFRLDQMATDIYTLATNYQSVNWSGGFRYQKLFSNLDFESSSFGGQFTWIF